MKKVFLLIMLVFIFAGCSIKSAFVRERMKVEYLTGKHNVEISIKKYGKIELELDADAAPITVTNFIQLVNDKFYDGLTFHRVVEGFMVQGGDPEGTGNGGSGNPIKGEFLANGIENNISHKRGVISMARTSNDYNSASSQFFIVQKDSDFLDNNYAGFGHVTKGIEIVDKIAKIPSDEVTGYVENDLQPVIEYIKVVSE